MINFILKTNIQKCDKTTCLTKKQAYCNLQALQQDTVKFSGKDENKPFSYKDFKEKFEKLNMSEKKFVLECISDDENRLGGGKLGYVYKIPFEEFNDYVIKVYKGSDFIEEDYSNNIEAISDIRELK